MTTATRVYPIGEGGNGGVHELYAGNVAEVEDSHFQKTYLKILNKLKKYFIFVANL